MIRRFSQKFIDNMGLKKRWVYSYFTLTIIILAIFEIAFTYIISAYYYDSATRLLKYRADNSIQFYKSYSNSESYDINDLAKQIIKDFGTKKNDSIELQVLDLSGNIIVSSTGFTNENKINTPDFKEALKGKIYNWRGDSIVSHEPIMATSHPVMNSDNEIKGIVRYIISLENINKSIENALFMSFVVIIVILFVVSVVSYAFGRTIIKPINEINKVAKKMAEGQYSERINTKYNDEIGELADTLNNMAEEIVRTNNLKNDFISSISHELRTPLTSIKGWSETILTGNFEDKEETSMGLKIIIKETTRLSKMVEELLDFSKMESGRKVLYLEEVNLATEIEEVINITKRRAQHEGIDLIYTKEGEIPNILGDFNRLKQVFINIIDNAIKFTEAGKSVKVRIYSNEEEVLIDIEDEGIGIPDSDIDFVKEKFFKGKSKKSGSGIGLAISNEIMEMHKGKLNIISEDGVGTKITLVFPKIKENLE
ncbi:MAG: ATP-binding protein [Andreesenia angusta]|nr:ATP-binding protein [Andreesenia angusta]